MPASVKSCYLKAAFMRGKFRHGKRGGGEDGDIYSEEELEVAATCRKFRQVVVNESKKGRARRSLIAADNFTAPTRINFFRSSLVPA